MGTVYIGYVEVHRSIAEKIKPRGISPEEVRALCESPARPERVSWHVHPEHGRRLIVYARASPRRLLKIVLHPIDVRDGTFRLKTAIVARKQQPVKGGG